MCIRDSREAERRFGVGHESAARWRRLRDGNLRANRPHSLLFPGAVDLTAIPAAISHCSGIASSRFSIPGIRHLPVSSPDGFFLRLIVKLLHPAEQVPVSYTHLDVYKRQVLGSGYKFASVI